MKTTWLTPLAVYTVAQTVLMLAVAGTATIEQYRLGHHYSNSIMPYIGSLFDLAGLLAFYCVVIHLAVLHRFSWRWRCITTLVLIALYVMTYCLLSFNGKYHASRSGYNRWNSMGLAVVDQDLWHAKGVFWQPFRTLKGQDTFQATYLGYFYSPLILFDRAFVHRTIHLREGQQ